MKKFDNPNFRTPKYKEAFETCIVSTFERSAQIDYLTARVLWRIGNFRGFSWSSSQAIEKLIKTVFLLNRRCAKFSHDYENHIATLEEIAGDLLPSAIDIPDALRVELDPDTPSSVSTTSAIKLFSRIGSAQSRYRESNLDIEPHFIHLLDGLFAILGRLCVDLDSERVPDNSWRDFLASDPHVGFGLREVDRIISRSQDSQFLASALSNWNFAYLENPPTPNGFHSFHLENNGTLVLDTLSDQVRASIWKTLSDNSMMREP